MDNLIHFLPEQIIRKISAGEFINNPSVILKELLENSLDAFSNNIKIYLSNNGLSLIKVIDNGSGIRKNDLTRSVQRHATSKICSLEDLNNINSFGFRGEALSSISFLSHFSISSKTKDNYNYGWICSNSKQNTLLFTLKPILFFNQKGTCVEVRDLFFNFNLKRNELNKYYYNHGYLLKKIIALFVVSNINVNFTIYIDNILYKKYIVFEKTMDNYNKRIVDIYGSEFFNSLIKINIKDKCFFLNGFFSLNKYYRATRIIFINNRIISNRNILYKFINNFFIDYYAKNVFSYILFFKIDTKFLNVNINPSKSDIKILNKIKLFKKIYKLLYLLISKKKYLVSYKKHKELHVFKKFSGTVYDLKDRDRNAFFLKNYLSFFLYKFGVILNIFNKRFLCTQRKTSIIYIDLLYIFFYFFMGIIKNNLQFYLKTIKINKIFLFCKNKKFISDKYISFFSYLGFKIKILKRKGSLLIENIPVYLNKIIIFKFFYQIFNFLKIKRKFNKHYIIYLLSYYCINYTNMVNIDIIKLIVELYSIKYFFNYQIKEDKIFKIINLEKLCFILNKDNFYEQ